MSDLLVASEIELSDEVVALAQKLGVTESLPKIVEMTQSVFRDTRIEARAYQDYEMADEWWILFVIWHTIDDLSLLLSMTRRWNQQLFDCCPAHRVSAFSIDLIEET